MFDNISNPGNRRILEYLAARNPTTTLLAPPESSTNPYYNLGSHPEIVERVWKVLAGSLPLDSRCIVHGTPALVHPATGLLLGILPGYPVRSPVAACTDRASDPGRCQYHHRMGRPSHY